MSVKTTVVATFPPGYFLENIAGTEDGGYFITCANRQELYYFRPQQNPSEPETRPTVIHQFARDQWAMGIIQAPQNPNVFYVLTTDLVAQGSCGPQLHVLDIANPAAGSHPYPILTFPKEAQGLNGMCALTDDVLLVADSFASCIWRIDLDREHFPPRAASAKVWLADDTMKGELVLPDFQPGVNGLKYSAVTGRVYYTNTQLRLFCQVGVNEDTCEAEGGVDVLAKGMQADDLIIDDSSESTLAAIVTTHRENNLLRVELAGRGQKPLPINSTVVVQGSESDDTMLGPTAGSWAPRAKGKTAYFTTDGGLKNVPRDGRVRGAKVVRVDFA